MARARRTFERPPVDLVAALSGFATTILSDAMGRAGAMHPRIQPVGAAVRMAGPASTVRVYPNDNFMCHVAVNLAAAGDILVIDGDNYVGGGLWGEMLTRAALARAIAGVVIDGAARDREAITELGLPVFACAVVPRGTHKRFAGDANVPVSCAGLTIEPGDIIVSDRDGVVVVPHARARTVLERARAAELRERGWREQLAAGKSMYEIAGIEAMLADSGIEWE